MYVGNPSARLYRHPIKLSSPETFHKSRARAVATSRVSKTTTSGVGFFVDSTPTTRSLPMQRATPKFDPPGGIQRPDRKMRGEMLLELGTGAVTNESSLSSK
ncbi:hypothetical protein TNCV_1835541 [Trichonephila clavipes]|nr:hypothetical protein TNCV_1835541 [Trichonephila clavipes]